MNDKTVLSLIIAMTLASGGYAFAQGNSDHRERGRDEQIERRDRHPPQPPPQAHPAAGIFSFSAFMIRLFHLQRRSATCSSASEKIRCTWSSFNS